MVRNAVPEAWVTLAGEEEVRKRLGAGNPYDFGFVPAMSRLVSAHGRIAPFFGALFAQVMFVPGSLDRREREMVAAVAAAAQDCHY
jgi:alkylhydroperoxidase/carboxymuconolactone decarboxylase family protein YurZ